MTYYFARYMMGSKILTGPAGHAPDEARKALEDMVREHQDTTLRHIRLDPANIQVREFEAPETLK